jgi:hypothetical protein
MCKVSTPVAEHLLSIFVLVFQTRVKTFIRALKQRLRSAQKSDKTTIIRDKKIIRDKG